MSNMVKIKINDTIDQDTHKFSNECNEIHPTATSHKNLFMCESKIIISHLLQLLGNYSYFYLSVQLTIIFIINHSGDYLFD